MFPTSPVNWSNPGFYPAPIGTPSVPDWALTGKPVGPGDFDADIQKAINDAVIRQQELNSGIVRTTVGTELSASIYNATKPVVELPWAWIVAGVVGLGAFVLMKR